MLEPGVGGIDKVIASIPRTVRVPVAYRLVNSIDCLAMLSRLGVSFSVLPNAPRNDALRLSLQIRMTL